MVFDFRIVIFRVITPRNLEEVATAGGSSGYDSAGVIAIRLRAARLINQGSVGHKRREFSLPQEHPGWAWDPQSLPFYGTEDSFLSGKVAGGLRLATHLV